VPATMAVIDGRLRGGLDSATLEASARRLTVTLPCGRAPVRLG